MGYAGFTPPPSLCLSVLESCGATERWVMKSAEGVSGGTTPANVSSGINIHKALKLPLTWMKNICKRVHQSKGTHSSCQNPGVLCVFMCVTLLVGIGIRTEKVCLHDNFSDPFESSHVGDRWTFRRYISYFSPLPGSHVPSTCVYLWIWTYMNVEHIVVISDSKPTSKKNMFSGKFLLRNIKSMKAITGMFDCFQSGTFYLIVAFTKFTEVTVLLYCCILLCVSRSQIFLVISSLVWCPRTRVPGEPAVP